MARSTCSGAYIGLDAGRRALPRGQSRLLGRRCSAPRCWSGCSALRGGGAAAAPHLPRAGAVPVARHLRRRADRAGRSRWRSGDRRTCWDRARPGCAAASDILGLRFPQYELLLIGVGPVVLGLLWLLFHRTRWGTLVRAATQDREMVGALGVNQRMAVHRRVLPRLPAGRTGRRAADPARERSTCTWTSTIVVEAFVVVVVGGMGSLSRRVSGGAADRRAAGLRHPDLPADHAGAGLPGHGGGAGGAAPRAARPAAGGWRAAAGQRRSR